MVGFFSSLSLRSRLVYGICKSCKPGGSGGVR